MLEKLVEKYQALAEDEPEFREDWSEADWAFKQAYTEVYEDLRRLL